MEKAYLKSGLITMMSVTVLATLVVFLNKSTWDKINIIIWSAASIICLLVTIEEIVSYFSGKKEGR